MEAAITETLRRRKIQTAYNIKHGITPTTIIKNINETMKQKTPLKKPKGEKRTKNE